MPRSLSLGLSRGLSRGLSGGRNPFNSVIDAIPCDLWYRFDESSGTSAFDSSNNGRSGTLFNGATPGVTGVNGLALSLDGVNDHVKPPVWTRPAARTIACWVKPTNIAAGVQVILGDGWGGNAGGSTLIVDASGHPAAQVVDGAGNPTTISGTTVMTNGTWYHLANVTSGTVTTLYVNGVAEGTPFSSTPAVPVLGFLVGGGNYPAPAAFFAGMLDDVRFFPSALTAAQIAALYNYS